MSVFVVISLTLEIWKTKYASMEFELGTLKLENERPRNNLVQNVTVSAMPSHLRHNL